MSNSTEIETLKSHPMEDILDIDPGSTITTKITHNTESEADLIDYDEKDDEIEEQILELYDAAMGAFETQMEEAELVEGKYKARNGEVAVQFLNAALTAIKERSGLKQHKDKVAVSKGKLTGAKPQTNIIIADRNELLKTILDGVTEPPKPVPKIVNPPGE